MSHTPLFDQLLRTLRLARFADVHGLSTSAALEQAAALEASRAAQRATRREFLRHVVGGAGALAVSAGLHDKALALGKGQGGNASGPSIGIIGAGLAGLVCADELRQAGIAATLYEAANRVGGRQWSLAGLFPGQVVERGGELIDNLHKTMLGYVNEFNLTREDGNQSSGETAYYVDGQHYTEAEVVNSYRAFVAAMRSDLRRLSSAPTADVHNAYDVMLDNLSLAEYLETRGADDLLTRVMTTAYEGEYGLAADVQSSLNFLMLIHADKRSKLALWGVFSDERFHVVEGNEAIAQGIAARLTGPTHLGMRLTALRQLASGQLEATFSQSGKTVTRTHDAMVVTLPFSVLREVRLDASLALTPGHIKAIQELSYGTNAKTMVGFTARPWVDQGYSGELYAAGLPDVQVTWETNPINATPTRGVLTDYSSGQRGLALGTTNIQTATERWLDQLDQVFPGVRAAARRHTRGHLVLHHEPWPSHALSKGSYTCYTTGQFTTIAGNEGKPAGNLHFAGEHTNSFYVWQGFMEGACLSGIQAAREILADIKTKRL